jgi:hypothetical protein
MTIAGLGGLECALWRQAGGGEGLPALEQQPDAGLQLAVAGDRIAVQEPDRMGVPDL